MKPGNEEMIFFLKEVKNRAILGCGIGETVGDVSRDEDGFVAGRQPLRLVQKPP